MSRGDHQEAIYRDDEDRSLFLDTFGEACAKTGALTGFRWSSFPEYLKPLRKRPTWLEVARVLGSLGIGRDDARGRKGYRAWIDGQDATPSGKAEIVMYSSFLCPTPLLESADYGNSVHSEGP